MAIYQHLVFTLARPSSLSKAVVNYILAHCTEIEPA